MQPLKFDNISALIDFLPDQERNMVLRLRQIIHDCLPYTKEKLSYNVPYYFGHSRICYIWPASVPWGKVRPEGVLLGFCNGYLLADSEGYLDTTHRKQIATKTFVNIAQIDPLLLTTFLQEAWEIDRKLHIQKEARKK